MKNKFNYSIEFEEKRELKKISIKYWTIAVIVMIVVLAVIVLLSRFITEALFVGVEKGIIL